MRPVSEGQDGASTGSVRVVEFSRGLLDGLEGDEEGPRQVDLAALPVFEDERPLGGVTGLLDWRGDGYLSRIVRGGTFDGRAGETLLTPGGSRLLARRVILFGLGNSGDLNEARAREAARRIVGVCVGVRAPSILAGLPGLVEERSVLEAYVEELAGAVAELGHAHAPTRQAPPEAPSPKATESAAEPSERGPEAAPEGGEASAGTEY